ncbi:hypothetical protein GPECTOR_70g530 [Gonium pectorale]|uniref:Uncharacterized protein n=1 Tax=Gonium pectorale TaxID=33097 RepID=A0A150G344_GONPE|nr:hypothetical protein GPECTOR_70g530 [Gonium pectorale]|eukprot:KXZ44299.1 hypothetical protein GPECTOR_70g530 [Gonium pectorale]
MADTIASLGAALRVSRVRATALACTLPQLATLAPPTLAAKLTGLQRLLGPGATPQDLAAALDSAPRLLTFSTAALESHHADLVDMLGPAVVAVALRREPGLLALRPNTLAPKLRLLAELLGCQQQPAAVALLVSRHPGVLRRSLTALSRCCRALSIWALPPRTKLRMCLSRRGLLTLPWQEVHGRCRWLRRLMLGNAYYHAALRRLPPAVLARLISVLPSGWSRLQYLADSSQEGCMELLEAAECGQADFEARFPEFGRWMAWKQRQMASRR